MFETNHDYARWSAAFKVNREEDITFSNVFKLKRDTFKLFSLARPLHALLSATAAARVGRLDRGRVLSPGRLDGHVSGEQQV